MRAFRADVVRRVEPGRRGAERRASQSIVAAVAPFPVLFVCIGNVCRSPYAEILLRSRLTDLDAADRFDVGSAGVFALSTPKPGDALTLELPDWGTGLAAARLSVPDIVFLAAFATYARRFGLRERAAEAGMLCALLVAAAAEILFDAALPSIALLAAGYLIPNADLLGGLVARVRAE